jgi:hypothetical protein
MASSKHHRDLLPGDIHTTIQFDVANQAARLALDLTLPSPEINFGKTCYQQDNGRVYVCLVDKDSGSPNYGVNNVSIWTDITAGASGGQPITVLDDGTPLTTNVSSINVTGNATLSVIGDAVTIDVVGGGGGGGAQSLDNVITTAGGGVVDNTVVVPDTNPIVLQDGAVAFSPFSIVKTQTTGLSGERPSAQVNIVTSRLDHAIELQTADGSAAQLTLSPAGIIFEVSSVAVYTISPRARSVSNPGNGVALWIAAGGASGATFVGGTLNIMAGSGSDNASPGVINLGVLNTSFISIGSSSNSTYFGSNLVSIQNDLDIQGDVTIVDGGTIDGIDLSSFKSEYDTHGHAPSDIDATGITDGYILTADTDIAVWALPSYAPTSHLTDYNNPHQVEGEQVRSTNAPSAGYVLSSTAGGISEWVAPTTPGVHDLGGPVHTSIGEIEFRIVESDGAGGVRWANKSAGTGDVVSSESTGTTAQNEVVVFSDANGKNVNSSSVLVTDLVVTTDSRLSDTRVPTNGSVGLAKLADGTPGNLITYGALNAPEFVATGDLGNVLTSNGAGAAPSFQALPVTGDVTGPLTNVNENLAVFDGVNSKAIKDGGVGLAAISTSIAHYGITNGNPHGVSIGNILSGDINELNVALADGTILVSTSNTSELATLTTEASLNSADLFIMERASDGAKRAVTAGTIAIASELRTATGTVALSTATAPTAGQVLKAINATSASWQNDLTGGGGGASSILVEYATFTGTQTLPSSGQVGITYSGGTAWSNINNFYVDAFDADGVQINAIWTRLRTGDTVVVREENDRTKYGVYALVADPIPSGTQVQVQVAAEANNASALAGPVSGTSLYFWPIATSFGSTTNGDVVSSESTGTTAQNEVVVFSDANGKNVNSSSVLVTDLVVTTDGRLSDDRVASAIRTDTGTVTFSTANAPAIGQVLKANSSTTAIWANDEVGGGGSPVEVQDGGSSLTSGVTLLNFIGFTVAEDPLPNQITITNVGDVAGSGTAVVGNIAIYDNANGKSIEDSLVAISDVVVTTDGRLSDDRVASGIRTATGVVAVSTATAPTTGQVLKAINGTSASWQDDLSGSAGNVTAAAALTADYLVRGDGTTAVKTSVVRVDSSGNIILPATGSTTIAPSENLINLGPSLTIHAGDSNTNVGGDLTLSAGVSGAAAGGDLILTAGDSVGISGGNVSINPGVGSVAGNTIIGNVGGDVTIGTGGLGTTTFSSNIVHIPNGQLEIGIGVGSSNIYPAIPLAGVGGHLILSGGGTSGATTGGDVVLRGGNSTSGTDGRVLVGQSQTLSIELGAVGVPTNVAGNLVVTGTVTSGGTALVLTNDSRLGDTRIPTNGSVGLTQLATGIAGNLITYNASNAPAFVATSATVGHVLKSAGTGQPPAFGTLVAGSFASNTIPVSSIATQLDSGILSFGATGAASYVGPGVDGTYLRSNGTGLAPTWSDLPPGGGTLTVQEDGGSDFIATTLNFSTGIAVTESPTGTALITVTAGGIGDVISSESTGTTAQNEVVVFSDANGKNVNSSSVLITNLVVTTDSRLSDTRIPTDNSVGLNQLAIGTPGNLITYGADTEPAFVATSANAGYVLKSAGTGQPPSFGQIEAAGITNSTITNSKLAPMPAYTIKGNNTASPADPANLIVSEIDTLLGKGVANGYASLDGTGRIPSSQLATSAFEFLGNWNPTTNTPTLADGTGNVGDLYRVSVESIGTPTLGGNSTWKVGDQVVYDGSVWLRFDTTGAVWTVNSQAGDVVLDYSDVGAAQAGHTHAGVDLTQAIGVGYTLATNATGTFDLAATPTTLDALNTSLGSNIPECWIQTTDPTITNPIDVKLGDIWIDSDAPALTYRVYMTVP